MDLKTAMHQRSTEATLTHGLSTNAMLANAAGFAFSASAAAWGGPSQRIMGDVMKIAPRPGVSNQAFAQGQFGRRLMPCVQGGLAPAGGDGGVVGVEGGGVVEGATVEGGAGGGAGGGEEN